MAFDSRETAKKIEKILEKEFSPTELVIEDDSHHHRGHQQAGGGGHFYVKIRSARFSGLSALARQRLVLDAVKPLMDAEIHALSMSCLPPAGN